MDKNLPELHRLQLNPYTLKIYRYTNTPFYSLVSEMVDNYLPSNLRKYCFKDENIFLIVKLKE